MKFTDVKLFTKDQLKDEVLKLKKEQFNLRFQTGFRPSRKHIAYQADSPRHRPSQDGAVHAICGEVGE